VAGWVEAIYVLKADCTKLALKMTVGCWAKDSRAIVKSFILPTT